jgi:hypothetical protein
MISASVLADNKCTGECLKSGPWGLAIILLLGIACYFLFRSMSKHMKKVRTQQAEAEQAARESRAKSASVKPQPPASGPTETDHPVDS